MIPADRIPAGPMPDPMAGTRIWLTCSACGGDIDCLPDGPPPSLIECVCPHCGMADVYPESRLRNAFDGR